MLLFGDVFIIHTACTSTDVRHAVWMIKHHQTVAVQYCLSATLTGTCICIVQIYSLALCLQLIQFLY